MYRAKNGLEASLIALGAVVGFFALIIGGTLLNGWVLEKLWGWFVTPIGPPDLSIPNAIGIAIIVRYLTERPDSKKDDRPVDKNKLVAALIYPFLALLSGYIVHKFM